MTSVAGADLPPGKLRHRPGIAPALGLRAQSAVVTRTVSRGSHSRKAPRGLLQELPMNTYLRRAVGLSCVGLLVLGVVLLDPACPLPSPPPGDPTIRRPLAEELERMEQLDQRADHLDRKSVV